MVGPLVFVLALLGFSLLVIAERIGLPVFWARTAMEIMVALCVLALGMARVTSRFTRFCEGQVACEGRGLYEAHGAQGTARGGVTLLVRCACMLVALVTLIPGGVDFPALVPGLVAGVGMAHLAGPWLVAPLWPARLARMLLAFALALLAMTLLNALLVQLAGPLPLSRGQIQLVLGGLLLLALLPGGARGVDAVQGLVLALALVVSLSALAFMLSTNRADLLTFDLPGALMPALDAMASPFHPTLAGLVLGVLGGVSARGTGAMSHPSVAAGVLGGLIAAGVLVLLYILANDGLARIVSQRILGLPPAAWPPFVFEPDLAGWMHACGASPVDPLAVARACRLSGPAQIPKPADITFLASLSLPALAAAHRLPLLLGDLWALLPLLLGSAGLLSVLHGAGLAFSESVLFGLLNPSGLFSFRLAMVRLSVLALVVALLMAGTPLRLTLASLTGVLAVLLGGVVLLLAYAGVARTSRVTPSEGAA